jgi:integrase
LRTSCVPYRWTNVRTRYPERLTGSDLFADDGPPKTYRATTIKLRRELIRIAGSSLVESGFPAAKLLSLDDLIAPENAKELLRVLHRRAGEKKTSFVRSVATELVFIASKYQRAAQPTTDALKDLRRKLGAPPPGLTEKNQLLLTVLEDEELLNKLVALPSRLAARARTTRMSQGRRSQQMQIALAIELLLCAPMRLANLEALELGKHLPRNIRPGRETLLSFVAKEMKNDRPMTFSLSLPATHLLHEYLRDFRPLLATPGQAALFVGPDGGARKADTLRDAITKAIKLHLDIHMTPHQFRHLAGHLLLRANPSNYAVVQQLLGHANLKTTTNFYIAGQSRGAFQMLDEILSKRRQPTRAY